MKDLSPNFFGSALIPPDAEELLIKITMARTTIELISFKSQEALSQSNQFMANLSEVNYAFYEDVRYHNLGTGFYAGNLRQ